MQGLAPIQRLAWSDQEMQLNIVFEARPLPNAVGMHLKKCGYAPCQPSKRNSNPIRWQRNDDGSSADSVADSNRKHSLVRIWGRCVERLSAYSMITGLTKCLEGGWYYCGAHWSLEIVGSFLQAQYVCLDSLQSGFLGFLCKTSCLGLEPRQQTWEDGMLVQQDGCFGPNIKLARCPKELR